jgi:hypothetical protein
MFAPSPDDADLDAVADLRDRMLELCMQQKELSVVQRAITELFIRIIFRCTSNPKEALECVDITARNLHDWFTDAGKRWRRMQH